MDEIKKVIAAAGSYKEWALEQRKLYIELRLNQDPEIRTLYTRVIDKIGDRLREIEVRGSTSLTYRHLEMLEYELRRELTLLGEGFTDKTDQYLQLSVQAGSYLSKKVTIRGLDGIDLDVKPYERSIVRMNKNAVRAMWTRSNKGMYLSDRIWKVTEGAGDSVRDILREAVVMGQSPIKTAQLLQKYVREGKGTLVDQYPELMKRVNPPKDLVYEALRLARTEMTAAYGEGVIGAATISPSSTGVQWVLSPSHPVYDICDVHAEKDNGLGKGVYRPDEIPLYPPHPNCLCTLVPVHQEPVDFINRLKKWQQDPQSEPDIERWYQDEYLAA